MAIALDMDHPVAKRQHGRHRQRSSESAVGLGMDPANRWLVTAGAKGTIKVWPDYGRRAPPPAQTIEMRLIPLTISTPLPVSLLMSMPTETCLTRRSAS